MSQFNDHLLSNSFLPLKLLAALYVVALPLAHGLLPSALVWPVALFFLIAMLPTYFVFGDSDFKRQELFIALLLAAMGIAGIVYSPWFIIAGIFLHGTWDILKHYGLGTPFFTWYVLGCAAVDWTYAIALTFYNLQGMVT